ncbi:hypothetical protein M9H77_34092 [Catharanthus roseus]|uniref:Uncharacterized protein n=1 Tax=Catharanthus roseus TaxID=4058 RepID=A0ACB9ZMD2_CATRO|nr:hypothetical protein M9H77_34092 [Catharanthus roseus]
MLRLEIQSLSTLVQNGKAIKSYQCSLLRLLKVAFAQLYSMLMQMYMFLDIHRSMLSLLRRLRNYGVSILGSSTYPTYIITVNLNVKTTGLDGPLTLFNYQDGVGREEIRRVQFWWKIQWPSTECRSQ